MKNLITNDVKVCTPSRSRLWKRVDYLPSSAVRVIPLSHLEIKVLCLFKLSGAISTPVCSRLASFHSILFEISQINPASHRALISVTAIIYMYIFVYIVCVCVCAHAFFWTNAVQFVIHLKCPNVVVKTVVVASLHSPLFALPHNNNTSVFHAVI